MPPGRRQRTQAHPHVRNDGEGPWPEPGEPSMSEIVRVAKISQPMTATHLAGTAGKGRPRGVVIHFDALPAPIARIRNVGAAAALDAATRRANLFSANSQWTIALL